MTTGKGVAPIFLCRSNVQWKRTPLNNKYGTYLKTWLVSLTEVYRIQSNIYLTNLFRRGKKHTKRLLFEFNAALSLQMAFELFWKYAYVLSPLNLKASCQLLDNFPACMSKMIIRMKILPLLVFMSNLQCSNLSIVFAIRNSITPKLVTFGTDQKTILG